MQRPHRSSLISPTRDRDLERYELLALLALLASRRELWDAHVHHDPAERTYHRLHWDKHLELWVIGWMPGHDTGFHDHGFSAGAVIVVSGEVCERRLVLDGSDHGRVYRAGELFDFDASEIHRVTHAGSDPAVTLHAYSPPLQRVGAYVTDSAGRLKRRSMSEGETLRPLT